MIANDLRSRCIAVSAVETGELTVRSEHSGTGSDITQYHINVTGFIGEYFLWHKGFLLVKDIRYGLGNLADHIAIEVGDEHTGVLSISDIHNIVIGDKDTGGLIESSIGAIGHSEFGVHSAG